MFLSFAHLLSHHSKHQTPNTKCHKHKKIEIEGGESEMTRLRDMRRIVEVDENEEDLGKNLLIKK